MLLKNIKLEDPLNELALPLFAKKLKINHFSPTQFSIPDGNWIFKYLVLTQEERRLLPANAQMKAGVAIGNILQKHFADTIYVISPLTKKLSETKNKNKGRDRQELIHEEIQNYRDYIPNDDKDQAKKDKSFGVPFELGPVKSRVYSADKKTINFQTHFSYPST